MDIDLQLENFIHEATSPRQAKTVCWVVGTDGLDPDSFTYTVQCELLVPESIREQIIDQDYRKGMGLPDIKEIPLRLPGADENGMFPTPEAFLKFILDRDNKDAKEMREWLRLYPPTPSEFSQGMCMQMANADDYESFAKNWYNSGFSREGTWYTGQARHEDHDPECEFCLARLNKHTAGGSPTLNDGTRYSKETIRKYLSGTQRPGKGYGYACGDPVRPKVRSNVPGKLKGTRLRAQDNPATKLWPHTRNKALAKIIQIKYAPLVLQAIKDRLDIPKESEELFYGPQKSSSIWPSNMTYYMVDEDYVKAHLGKAPEVQHRPWRARTNLEYLVSHNISTDASEAPRFLDLSKIEKHYIYTVSVDIALDQELPWDLPEETKKAIPSTETWKTQAGVDKAHLTLTGQRQDAKGTSLRDKLIQAISIALQRLRISPEKHDAAVVDQWIDSHGNCFPILKIPTGIKGLDALLNPFMPSKVVLENNQVFTDEQLPKDVIPQYSKFWSFGGRDATHLYENLNEFLKTIGDSQHEISLAPYSQFAPYPIDRDGNIYVIYESTLLKLKNGQSIVGRIIEDTWDNYEGERTNESYQKDQLTGHYVVEIKQLKPSKKLSKTINVPALNNPIVVRRIKKRTFKIKKSQIAEKGTAKFDTVSFDSIDKLHGTVVLFDDEAEEDKVRAEVKRLLKEMDSEQIDKLLSDIKTDIKGEKTSDQQQSILTHSPSVILTKPELIFGKLIKELQKPREVVDTTGRWYLVSEWNDDRSQPISFASCNAGTSFSWEAIENPDHPHHPYYKNAKGEFVHPLWADNLLMAFITKRGDEYNPLTRSFERRKKITRADRDGNEITSFIDYNSTDYLRNYANLADIKEDIRTKRRLSAEKSNSLKDILINIRPTAADPKAMLSHKAYQQKMAYEQKLTTSNLEMWSKKWTEYNLRRIGGDDSVLYPSPKSQIVPSWDCWLDENGHMPPDTSQMNLEGNVGDTIPAPVKRFWLCRQCGGSGYVDETSCPRCQDPRYVKELSQHDGTNVREIFRDLWTGREWIQYIRARKRYQKLAIEELRSAGQEGSEIEKFEFGQQMQIRRLLLEEVIRPYDLNILSTKIQYQVGKPIDLSKLSKLDVMMLAANWGETPPYDARDSENADKISQWVSAMIAINTSMSMKVLPPEVQALIANQEISPDIRMDTLYTEILSAEEIDYLQGVDRAAIKRLAKARNKEKQPGDEDLETDDPDYFPDVEEAPDEIADIADNMEPEDPEYQEEDPAKQEQEKQEALSAQKREIDLMAGRGEDTDDDQDDYDDIIPEPEDGPTPLKPKAQEASDEDLDFLLSPENQAEDEALIDSLKDEEDDTKQHKS